jgi:uncharacterized protein (TIGR00297 family)
VTPGIALLVAVSTSCAALLGRALTTGGAVAAALVGSAILVGAGWPGGAVLLAFFLGGTIISKSVPDPARERFDAKGTRRDAAQVLANGGVAGLAALCTLHPALCPPSVGAAALVSSLAVAAADTWASSLGAGSARPPRLITTGAVVPAGTSGAVSWIGSLGGAFGAASVGIVAALAFQSWFLLPLALGTGLAGMLLDSCLGATLQARFHCPACDADCDRPVHRCGAPAVHLSGWRWCGNDGVNFLATLAAGVTGGLIGIARLH